MRVGFFVAFADAAPSGHITYQSALLDGLLQSGQPIVVFARHGEPVPEVRTPHELVRYSDLDPVVRRWVPSRVALAVTATRAIERSHLDVLIANGNWAIPNPSGVRRVVILYEALFDRPTPWGMYPAGFMRQFTKASRRALADAAAVVAISAHTAQGARALNPGVPVVVAPPAVAPFPPATGVPHPRPYVMSIGWFHPRKDLPLALAAWRKASDTGIDRDFLLVGALGPEDRNHGTVGRRVLEGVGRELSSRVRIVGPVSRPALGALLRHADALLVTSHHEGFGIPVLEAFSVGTPVVAASRGALPEAVGSAGVVAPPEPDSLAAALAAVLAEPPPRESLIEYASTYTVERQTAPILEILDRLEAS